MRPTKIKVPHCSGPGGGFPGGFQGCQGGFDGEFQKRRFQGPLRGSEGGVEVEGLKRRPWTGLGSEFRVF